MEEKQLPETTVPPSFAAQQTGEIRGDDMESVLILTQDRNDRTAFLDGVLAAAYHVEYISDPDAVIAAIRARSEQIYALVIDNPSGMERAAEMIAYVAGANSYLFAIPILILTDAAHRAEDEEYLDDTVIAAIEVGQSPRLVLHTIRKAHDTISSFSFQEFSRILKALPSLIYMKDAKARYVFCSQYWHHLAHYDEENWTIRGKTDLEIRKDEVNARAAYESDLRIIESGVGSSYIIEENDDGLQEFLQIIKEPIRGRDGRITGIIAIINNVTEQEKLRRELKRKSVTDELTGLYNRMFYDDFTARATEDIYPIGVISADCDGLKTINDLYGHAVGDEYIRMAATLLRTVLPEDAIMIRMGGDEYLCILPRTDGPALAEYGEQLRNTAKMFAIKDRFLSVSFGTAVVKDAADSLKERIAQSDDEMYRNKRAKESWM